MYATTGQIRVRVKSRPRPWGAFIREWVFTHITLPWEMAHATIAAAREFSHESS